MLATCWFLLLNLKTWLSFVGVCSVAALSYMIIHSVSKITAFPVYVVLPLQELQDKHYKTLIL